MTTLRTVWIASALALPLGASGADLGLELVGLREAREVRVDAQERVEGRHRHRRARPARDRIVADDAALDREHAVGDQVGVDAPEQVLPALLGEV